MIKAQEQQELKQVELEVQQEHEEAKADIAAKTATEREKRVGRLQKELQEFNRKHAGLQGELAFSEKLAQYKDQVADLDA